MRNIILALGCSFTDQHFIANNVPIEFPKHLTSDFTQILLDSQSPIKRLDQKPVIVDDDDGMFEINDEPPDNK